MLWAPVAVEKLFGQIPFEQHLLFQGASLSSQKLPQYLLKFSKAAARWRCSSDFLGTALYSLVLERLLGTVVGRLLSTTAVRAQALCLLARVGLITPAAREAAGRREVAMRQVEEMTWCQWHLHQTSCTIIGSNLPYSRNYYYFEYLYQVFVCLFFALIIFSNLAFQLSSLFCIILLRILHCSMIGDM